MTRLSKSRIISALQCPRKAHLEVHRPELAKTTAAMEQAFAFGHQVGDLAIELYTESLGAEGESAFIPYDGGSLEPQLHQTGELMTSMFRAPIFEATLQHDGVLVREDVLIPVDTCGQQSWRIVEVKAATKLKDYYIHDCAVQAWVHLHAGFPLEAIALAHVNNQFKYQGDGNYQGLLVETDLTEKVWPLLGSVPIWVDHARTAVDGPMPDVPVGQHCTKPHTCPFMDHCWPSRENGDEYPISGLGGLKQKQGEMVAAGYRDIRDIPALRLNNESQQRIHRITKSGKAELLPAAGELCRALDYPRFYLDFETVGPPIPIWPDTRPYQAIPFQFSCHIERGPGLQSSEMPHAEFLDASGDNPMRPLAEAMIAALESNGPVLMYTTYERQVIQTLISALPDLADELQAIIDRLVDLQPIAKQNYYHPDMLGSWSIKAILPTVAPDMDYAQLEGVHEGNEAVAAYREAIHADTSAQRREQIAQLVGQYSPHLTM